MDRNRKLRLVLYAFTMVVGLEVYGNFSNDPSKYPPKTVSVMQGDAEQYFHLNGILKAVSYVPVELPKGVVVEKIWHTPGTYVAQGTPLVTLKAIHSEELLAPTSMELNQFIAAENQKKTEWDQLKVQKEKGIISSERLQMAEKSYLAAQMRRQTAEFGLKRQSAGVLLVDGKAINATIKSPVAGIIAEQNLQEGQAIESNLKSPPIKVYNLNQLTFISPLKAGQEKSPSPANMPVALYFPCFANHKLMGRLETAKILPNSHQVEYTLSVKELPPTLALRLHDGLVVHAQVITEVVHQALFLPRYAVRFTSPENAYVFSEKSYTTAIKVKIKPGIVNDKVVQVQDGLALGQPVLDLRYYPKLRGMS